MRIMPGGAAVGGGAHYAITAVGTTEGSLLIKERKEGGSRFSSIGVKGSASFATSSTAVGSSMCHTATAVGTAKS